MELPFLNPWLLLALPAVGIPVLIHLLNRHRSVTIEWGAMELLRRVMVFRSRQIRLEDLLLMLLRCAVVALCLLAVARPTTRRLPLVRRDDTGVVIALDASGSMACRAAAASRFDEALRRVRELVGTLPPARPLTLVALAARPQVLLRNVGCDPARVERVLRELQPSAEPLNVEEALAALAPLAAEIKAPRREAFLVTDAQAASFGKLSDKARQALRELAAAAETFLVAVPPGSEENLAVTRLDLASGVLRVGAMARFEAVVTNFGRAVQDAGEVSLLVNDEVVDRRFVGRLGPGRSAGVHLYAPLQRAGAAHLSARAGDDALSGDNVRRAVIDVRSVVRVLCVDGEAVGPAATWRLGGGAMGRSGGSAAALVATALSPAAIDRSEARPEVETISWTALPTARLADFDVVVLVDVADVPADKAAELRRFVEQGGGLVMLPGNNVKPDTLHRRFLAAGCSLLPAELLAAAEHVGQQPAPAPLDLELPDHPLARPLRSLPKELLGEAKVYRFLRVRALPETRTVLRLAAGEPLLLERTVGRGKVLLCTTAADRAWSNLAVNPAFPMLLQQAVTELSRRPFETPVTVGQPVVLPLPGMAAGEDVAVTGPDGKAETARSVLRAGEVLVQTAPTAACGFYGLQPQRQGQTMTVAVNADAGESDVKVLDSRELSAAVEPLPVRVLGAEANVAAAVAQARTGRELWPLLLTAALVLLAAEAMLARWYTRRGT